MAEPVVTAAFCPVSHLYVKYEFCVNYCFGFFFFGGGGLNELTAQLNPELIKQVLWNLYKLAKKALQSSFLKAVMFNSSTESFPAKQLPYEAGLMTTCLAPNGSVKQLEHLAAKLPDVALRNCWTPKRKLREVGRQILKLWPLWSAEDVPAELCWWKASPVQTGHEERQQLSRCN